MLSFLNYNFKFLMGKLHSFKLNLEYIKIHILLIRANLINIINCINCRESKQKNINWKRLISHRCALNSIFPASYVLEFSVLG